jgi:hypothetical protein
MALRKRLDEAERQGAERAAEAAALRERLTAAEARAAAIELEAEASAAALRAKLVEAARVAQPEVSGPAGPKLADAEARAERAERDRERLDQRAEELLARTAKAEELGRRSDEEASRAKGRLEKEAAAARAAETRARNAEALAKSAEERASMADARRRSAEGRALEAEGRAQVAERRLHESEHRMSGPGSAKAPEASDGLMVPLRARVTQLEQSLGEREGEIRRLTLLAEKASRELDEARAETGRKLGDLKETREHQIQLRAQLERAQREADDLRAKLARSGDADVLKQKVDARDQEIARLSAEARAIAAEKSRLRAAIQGSEQAQVTLERRIAELEAALSGSNQKVELLERDLRDRTERLRRLSSGIGEGG